MTTRDRATHTLTALVTLAALTLSGCTGDDPPPRTDNSSGTPRTSTGASPTAPDLQDRSAEVLDSAAPLASVATTKGRSSSSFRGATFTIHALTGNTASTLLQWSVTGGPGTNSNDAIVGFWEKYPTMVVGGQEYSVVTFEKEKDSWAAVSNPFLPMRDGTTSPPQTALYPPLSQGTTKVTLKSEWFEDVTVPVASVP